MVQARGGDIVLNARHFGGTTRRLTARSGDGGQSWTPLELAMDLPGHGCMGGVVRVDGAHWVHTAPNGSGTRHRGTVWESRDDGMTWQAVQEIEPGSFAYSVPVVLESGTVAVVAETADYTRIRFYPVMAAR